MENGVLHIQRAINRLGKETRGKNDNARRYIALPDRALSVLEEQRNMLRRYEIIALGFSRMNTMIGWTATIYTKSGPPSQSSITLRQASTNCATP